MAPGVYGYTWGIEPKRDIVTQRNGHICTWLLSDPKAPGRGGVCVLVSFMTVVVEL